MSHCVRHDVPMLPGALGCPVCAAEPDTLTVVCAWRHTHEDEKHISGPPKSEGARVSHGLCAECLEVERRAWAAEAEEMRAARERARGGV